MVRANSGQANVQLYRRPSSAVQQAFCEAPAKRRGGGDRYQLSIINIINIKNPKHEPPRAEEATPNMHPLRSSEILAR